MAALAARSVSQVSQGRRSEDPEQYVDEVMEGAKNGIDLERRFRRFMDALVKELQRKTRHDDVMLVVSLDDTDMHPALVVPVLRCLYLFYHPRLAYVITGHSDLFRARLEASILQWWGLPGAEHATLSALGTLSQVRQIGRAHV